MHTYIWGAAVNGAASCYFSQNANTCPTKLPWFMTHFSSYISSFPRDYYVLFSKWILICTSYYDQWPLDHDTNNKILYIYYYSSFPCALRRALCNSLWNCFYFYFFLIPLLICFTFPHTHTQSVKGKVLNSVIWILTIFSISIFIKKVAAHNDWFIWYR